MNMSLDIFCQVFEAEIPQLRKQIGDALRSSGGQFGYRSIWVTFEEITILVLTQALTQSPLNMAAEDIIVANSKSIYPNIKIKYKSNEYAIDIKSGEDSHHPWYDIGRLETYYKHHLQRYAAEYTITVRWENRHHPKVIDVYIEPTYKTVGYSSLYNGVLYRRKDGMLRPKSWEDFEKGFSHWENLEEFKHGLLTAKIIRRKLRLETLHREFLGDVLSLIANGESQWLEFKSTACWEQSRNKKSVKLVENVVRTITSFMNSKKGGALLIGVADNGRLTGLANDYSVADPAKPNRDGFELFLRNSINDRIGADCSPFYEITFHNIEGQEICQVDINATNKPVFYEGELHVRSGNQSLKLSTQEALEYIKHRWSGF